MLQNLKIGSGLQRPTANFMPDMKRRKRMMNWMIALIMLGLPVMSLPGQGPLVHEVLNRVNKVGQQVREGKVKIHFSLADGPPAPDGSFYGGLERGMAATVVVVVQKVRTYRQFYLGSKGGGPSSDVYERVRELCRGKLSGSGFVLQVHQVPYVVTNLHVVDQASDSVGSILAVGLDGRVHPMRLLCGDALYDFAVLAFADQAPILDSLSYRRSTAAPLRIGEPVYAIGNPLGEYPWTIANGIVSGLSRNLGTVTGRFPFIQTTVPIHTGNSGGPLLDSQGQVVGMMSQIAMYPDRSPMAQTSFALDARTCERLTHDIVSSGRVIRSWFGIQLEAVNVPYGAGGSVELPASPMLRDVLSSASSRGILERFVGWKLVQIGDRQVNSLDVALELLESHNPSKQATLVFSNSSGGRETVTVAPQVMDSTHLVEIANTVLLPPTFINSKLEVGDPVVVDVEGARWDQPGRMVKCFVLAAGMLEAENPFWYETMKPEELGAAIQLLAPHRMVDLLVVPETQRSDTAAIRTVQVPIGTRIDGGKVAATVFH